MINRHKDDPLVFCSKCKYCSYPNCFTLIGDTPANVFCLHPTNIITEEKITWFCRRVTVNQQKELPSKLNTNNDCKLFESVEI